MILGKKRKKGERKNIFPKFDWATPQLRLKDRVRQSFRQCAVPDNNNNLIKMLSCWQPVILLFKLLNLSVYSLNLFVFHWWYRRVILSSSSRVTAHLFIPSSAAQGLSPRQCVNDVCLCMPVRAGVCVCVCVCVREREREREKERERERKRERERETDTQRGRDRETDRETETGRATDVTRDTDWHRETQLSHH